MAVMVRVGASQDSTFFCVVLRAAFIYLFLYSEISDLFI